MKDEMRRILILYHLIQQVLKFENSTSRQLFENDVIHALESNQIQCSVFEERAQDILKNAFTQKKRNQRLEKFFKSVFSEVCMIHCNKLEHLVVMGKSFLNGVISASKLTAGNDFQ